MERADAPPDLLERGGILRVASQIFQRSQLGAAILPGVVALELVGQAVEARESAGEDNASLVAQCLGQHPAIGQEGALGGLMIALHQRDAGLAQGIESGGDCQLGRDIERLDQLRRHAILFGQVERARPRGQLDHLVGVGDRLESPAAVGAFDESGHAFGQDLPAEALGDQIDELLAAQDTHRVIGVHHLLLGAW